MKHRRLPRFATFALMMAVICLTGLGSVEAKITAISYERSNGRSVINISTDTPLPSYQVQQSSDGMELRVEVPQLPSDDLSSLYTTDDPFFSQIALNAQGEKTLILVTLLYPLDELFFRASSKADEEHGIRMSFGDEALGVSDYVPAQPTVAGVEDIDIFEGAYTMIVALLVVLSLFAIIIWFIRRLSPGQRLAATAEIRTISRSPIGNKKNIVVVEAFDEVIMLGEWDEGLCYIKTIDNEKTLAKIQLHDKKVHANFSSYLGRAVASRTNIEGLTHSIKNRMNHLRDTRNDDGK
ncbi:flagellar biosynthetic protein FliO [Desulfurispira natronophila]|uniref:Flagellar biosynthetic protein FliO n=1 Tax=Desulfurispira natronophila TaxID=682562 RepID=A0A7W7Y442_9BACT|nr:flagellar biosynthetic protein FliO [Desulfurispira natronophila]MBB5021694.1 flagellar biosynthetic protein FliO [Desulfurispira natronophila]